MLPLYFKKDFTISLLILPHVNNALIVSYLYNPFNALKLLSFDLNALIIKLVRKHVNTNIKNY